MKTYVVTFDTYKNRVASLWVIYCQANNAKDASVIAKDIWTTRGNKSHMFHVHGTKATKQNPDTWTIRTWRGHTHRAGHSECSILHRF